MSERELREEVERHHIAVTTAHLVEHGLDISTPSMLTKCPCCERERSDIRRRRINASYVDEERNWLESCGECFEETVEHYADLWADFYSGCM